MVDARPMDQRPWREVREYELIMQAEAQVSRSKSNG